MLELIAHVRRLNKTKLLKTEACSCKTLQSGKQTLKTETVKKFVKATCRKTLKSQKTTRLKTRYAHVRRLSFYSGPKRLSTELARIYYGDSRAKPVADAALRIA